MEVVGVVAAVPGLVQIIQAVITAIRGVSKKDVAPKVAQNPIQSLRNIQQILERGKEQGLWDKPQFEQHKSTIKHWTTELASLKLVLQPSASKETRAGCGKSVLIKSIAQKLGEQGQIALRFSFWSGNENQRRLEDLLRTLVWQILRHIKHVDLEKVSQLLARSDGIDKSSLVEALRIALSGISKKVYCTIDGIDESTEDWNSETYGRLSTILDLVKDHSNLRPLLAGRQHSLRTFLNRALPRLEITESLIRDDIAKLIAVEIHDSLESYSPVFRDEAQKNLEAKTQVMFLWVRLVLKELRRCSGVEDVRQTLQQVPHDLDREYHRLLLQLMTRTRGSVAKPSISMKRARYVLSSILACPEPMTGEDLCYAYATQVSVNGTIENDLITIEGIMDACGDFVRATEGRYHLIHASASDFLVRPKGEWEPEDTDISYFHVDLAEAHKSMSLACFKYIKSIDLGTHGPAVQRVSGTLQALSQIFATFRSPGTDLLASSAESMPVPILFLAANVARQKGNSMLAEKMAVISVKKTKGRGDVFEFCSLLLLAAVRFHAKRDTSETNVEMLRKSVQIANRLPTQPHILMLKVEALQILILVLLKKEREQEANEFIRMYEDLIGRDRKKSSSRIWEYGLCHTRFGTAHRKEGLEYMARSLLFSGSYRVSADFAAQAIDILADSGSKPRLRDLSLLGIHRDALYRACNLEKCIASCQQLLVFLRKLESEPVVTDARWKTQILIARCVIEQGNITEADTWFSKAADEIMLLGPGEPHQKGQNWFFFMMEDLALLGRYRRSQVIANELLEMRRITHFQDDKDLDFGAIESLVSKL
ncbi:tetratricopeptide-like helical [Fusarium tjaetaba]|uniref:Tetratricopeptide-like helical n=1 Tax=Fusarium tjaetaba TaxID=1567544 RepID=A0A8H5S701_9HYPO|nr:tetratricopeptide-like helical [Fusarium tjaetaba]KAF5646512.1 tetratricopeptide-like helical [Fusarium tjaetaba]